MKHFREEINMQGGDVIYTLTICTRCPLLQDTHRLHVEEEPGLNGAAYLVHLFLALNSRQAQFGKEGDTSGT